MKKSRCCLLAFLLFTITAASAKEKNIASLAKIKTTPSIKGGYSAARRMVDGDPETGAYFRKGVKMGGVFEFNFENPVNISKIRFLQGINQRFEKGTLHASDYLIKADTNNDGIYDTQLIESSQGTVGKWNERAFPPVKIYRIIFKAIKGSSQWETSYPFMREFEIYADMDSYQKLIKETTLVEPKPQLIPEDIKFFEQGEEIKTKPFTKEEKNTFIKGVVVNFWNFGLYPSRKEPNFNFKYKKIKEAATFNDFIGKLKYLNANTACLMRESGAQLDTVCWPSKNFKTVSPNRDFLQEFCSEMHSSDFKVHLLIHNYAALGYIGQSPKSKKIYSLTHNNAIREPWAKLIKEAASRDLDGIYIAPDEIFFRQFDLIKLDKKNPVRMKFEKRFGIEPPHAQAGFNKMTSFRKQIIFGYEQVGLLLKYWNDSAKLVNPDIVTLTNLSSSPLAYNNRYVYALAYDIIARNSGADYLGTDYQNRNMSKLVGASLNRKSSLIVFPTNDPGTALQAIFMGSKGLTFYRYNYIFNEKHDIATRAAFVFCDVLAQWGFANPRPPRKIAVVVSRASEDWWSWDHNLIHYGNAKNWKGKRGFFSYSIISELLQKYGYPYEVLYLDQMDSIKHLKDYSLAIMPFAYSVSKDAALTLEKAADKGTKFLILQKQGEVDEYGMKHPSGPILKKLVLKGQKNGNLLFIDRNLTEFEMESDFAVKIRKKIDSLLGKDKPLNFESHGNKVTAYVLEKTPHDKVVALINRENKPVKVTLGLPFANGIYEAHFRKSSLPTREYRYKLDGVSKMSNKNLSSFGLVIDSNETVMLHLKKIGD